jgi:hypothetical protein
MLEPECPHYTITHLLSHCSDAELAQIQRLVFAAITLRNHLPDEEECECELLDQSLEIVAAWDIFLSELHSDV